MSKILLLVIILNLLLLSCASDNKILLSHVELSHSEKLNISTRKFMELFPRNGQVIQLVKYSNGGDTKKAQVVFVRKVNHGKKILAVSVLSMFGMEIMSLEFDGEYIARKSGLPGINLAYFDRVMSDMLMIYSTEDTLRLAISGKFKIKKEKFKRILLGKTSKIISIKYNENKSWPEHVEFIQHELGYTLSIQTVSVKYESLH
jgi:hypothetical protein